MDIWLTLTVTNGQSEEARMLLMEEEDEEDG